MDVQRWRSLGPAKRGFGVAANHAWLRISPLEPVAQRTKFRCARCRRRAVRRHRTHVDAVVQLASFGGFDMRLDLTPYRRSTIGFDRLFDMLESNARAATVPTARQTKRHYHAASTVGGRDGA